VANRLFKRTRLLKVYINIAHIFIIVLINIFIIK